MIYMVYKTTNNINGKIYIGCHQAEHLNDKYLGSGKIIKQAINKYGINSFSRVAIAIFDNPKEMFALEEQLVSDEFVNRQDTYNIKMGGCGGWEHNKNLTEEQIERRILNYKKSMTEEKQKNRATKLRETWANKTTKEKEKHSEICKLAARARDEEVRINNFQKTMAGRDNELEKIRKQKISDKGSKKWIITSPSGEVIIVKGLRKFCYDNNLDIKSMYNSANGHKQIKHPGWKCQKYQSNDSSGL